MRVFFATAASFIGLAAWTGFVAAEETPVTYVSDNLEQTVSANFGGDGCDVCEEVETEDCGCSCYLFGPAEACTLFPENCHGITGGGWTQIGYHNKQTPLSREGVDPVGSALSFNDVPGRVRLQQQWLYLEKALSGDECNWDWGFRADFMYGTDASKTQGFGGNGWDTGWNHGIYGWAIPQLYGEIGKGAFSVKMGHFFTLVGYEVVTAPDNFFYSHALTMFNTEPFTHTGVVATYEASDSLTAHAGWTLGWDTGFERVNDGNSWLGGFSYQVCDDLSVHYVSTAGNFGSIGKDGYSHSIVMDASISDKLNYVFQSDYKYVESTGDDDVGINQYLFYSYNDCVALGTRMEWWKDDGKSYYELTGGVNLRPHANLVVRPEVRYDWSRGPAVDQTTFGMDAIVTY